MSVKDIIAQLDLLPHPEGGYYRETYRSDEQIRVHDRYGEGATRAYSTGIYYLLGAQDYSAWHQVQSDEMWHHYAGHPVKIMMLDPKTKHYAETVVGSVLAGHQPQCVVKRGTWFAAHVLHEGNDNAFALNGCTVAPGFDFADFTLAKGDVLCAEFPEHHAMIQRYAS